MFNPETRKYVWDVCKKNYYDYGINAFWLDNSEPDYGVYDFDHYRYIEGPALSCSNIYPQLYSRVFYDNMKDLGDVPSTFEAFYDQLQAGLNMGLAGIPWWTTDIGGGYLHTGQPNELWSYGEENYKIMKKYYDIRIEMHDYIKKLYDEASENVQGTEKSMKAARRSTPMHRSIRFRYLNENSSVRRKNRPRKTGRFFE